MNIVFFVTKLYDIISVGKILNIGYLKFKSNKIDILIIRRMYFADV